MTNLYHVAIATALTSSVALSLVSPTLAQQDPTTMDSQPQSEPLPLLQVQPWTTETEIGQIVAERPQASRIFDLVGIDYCCGGRTPLAKAAEELGIPADKLLSALLVVGTPTQGSEQRNWQKADIGELMDHIVESHHTWLRRELPPLLETTTTVYRVHGDEHQELEQVMAIVQQVQDAVLPHLDQEEENVFPAVRDLAAGNVRNDVARLLKEMRTDHDEIGAQLHELRKLTDGFAVPEDACAKYREMLTGLEALELDLHQHVHLENNVLLPRALKLLESASDR